ncbi:MAG: MFS transporter [Candidatus Sumerlaeaceae bacterium]
MMRGIVVVGAGVLVQLAMGALYAWSTFGAALQQHYGLEPGKAASIVGVAILTFTLVMIAGGRGVARFGPRVMTLCGAALFSIGYLVSSFAGGRYAVLVLGAGVLVGAGIGCTYTAPITASLAWFPQRKGLITGLSVAGFGAGALLLSQWAEWLLKQQWDVHHVLWMIAVVNGGAAFLGGLFLLTPAQPVAAAGSEIESKVIRLREVFSRQPFWAGVVGMFSATFGGLLVIGNLKSLGLSYGLAADVAATAIGIFAIGNAGGRLVWGGVYDRLGRWALPLALVLQGIVLAGLAHAQGAAFFIPLAATCGFLFGSAFVLYAADLASEYGRHGIAIIYPWVFLAYGIAGLLGPFVGGKLYEMTGSYVYACYIATMVSVGGALIYLLLRGMLTHFGGGAAARGRD